MSLLVFLFALSAQAQNLGCHLTATDGTTFDITLGGDTRSAPALSVNGIAVRATGPCFPIAHGQPGWGATVRCPFGGPGDRVEVYPIAGNGGDVSVGLIQWRGSDVVFRAVSKCQ